MTEAELVEALNAIREGAHPQDAQAYAMGLLLGFLSAEGYGAIVGAFFHAKERVPF